MFIVQPQNPLSLRRSDIALLTERNNFDHRSYKHEAPMEPSILMVASLISQRHEGIDLRCATRGKIGRENRDRHHHHARERQ